MHDRGYRDATSFGLRRAAGGRDGRITVDARGPGSRAPDAGGADPRGPDAPGSAPRTGVLAWALRSAALAGFVALFAAQYLVRLSGSVDAPSPRTVVAARGPLGDPETTGAIGPPMSAASGTRLDPCGLPGTARRQP